MGFLKQEYWNELPFPTPGGLLNPRIKPTSVASPALAGGFFIVNTIWEASHACKKTNKICLFFQYSVFCQFKSQALGTEPKKVEKQFMFPYEIKWEHTNYVELY